MAASSLYIYKNVRFSDVCEKPSKSLIVLKGYANKTLVSMEEAVKPLSELVPGIETQVHQAKFDAHFTDKALTVDEAAAIYLYTLDCVGNFGNLYASLQKTLQLQNQEYLKPWFPYMKLFLTALFKLPSMQCQVWRGTHLDLTNIYKKGELLCWPGFSSCSKSINSLQIDQDPKNPGASTIFSIECLNGKPIGDYSYRPNEDEILLLPCTYFQVINLVKQNNGSTIIHLRELKPPYVLVESPFHQTTQLPIPKAKVDNSPMIAAIPIHVVQETGTNIVETKYQSQNECEHDVEKCKSMSTKNTESNKFRCTHLHPRLEFCIESGVYVNPKSTSMTAIWYFYSPKNDQWFWTPYKNFAVWMSVFELKVTKGYWKDQQPAKVNIEIISYLATYNPIPPPSVIQLVQTIEDRLLKL